MMKATKSIVMMSAMMAMGIYGPHNGKRIEDLEVSEGDRVRLAEKYKSVQKANGMKEFNIQGEKIFALNEKNARRKFDKMKNL